MKAKQPLAGKTIVATRPEAEQPALVELLTSLGATVLSLPMLAIVNTTPDRPDYAATRAAILDLDLYSHIIFVSPSAARAGYDWVDTFWPQLPVGINWFSIGGKTQATLAALGIESEISDKGFDSEALLTHPKLQDVTDHRILIMRGEGGRPFLADELTKRGAKVDHAVLYAREAPVYETKRLHQTLYEASPHGILVTSVDGLNNLVTHSQALDKKAQKSVLNCTLVVPSQRVYDQAKALGFTRIKRSDGPDNAAMCAALTN